MGCSSLLITVVRLPTPLSETRQTGPPLRRDEAESACFPHVLARLAPDLRGAGGTPIAETIAAGLAAAIKPRLTPIARRWSA
jgi:hypothetical protein